MRSDSNDRIAENSSRSPSSIQEVANPTAGTAQREMQERKQHVFENSARPPRSQSMTCPVPSLPPGKCWCVSAQPESDPGLGSKGPGNCSPTRSVKRPSKTALPFSGSRLPPRPQHGAIMFPGRDESSLWSCWPRYPPVPRVYATVRNSVPTPAVTAIASAPQNVTRIAPLVT